jgi:hypothetical protein
VKRTIEPSASDRSAISHVGQRDPIRVHTKTVEVQRCDTAVKTILDYSGENDVEDGHLNESSCSSAPHSILMPFQRTYPDVVDTATVGTISYTIKSTITAIHGSEDK